MRRFFAISAVCQAIGWPRLPVCPHREASTLELLAAVAVHLGNRCDALLIVSPAAAARQLGTRAGVKIHNGSGFVSRDDCDRAKARPIDAVTIPIGWEEWPATAPRPGWRDQLPETLQPETLRRMFGDVLGSSRDVERPLTEPPEKPTESAATRRGG